MLVFLLTRPPTGSFIFVVDGLVNCRSPSKGLNTPQVMSTGDYFKVQLNLFHNFYDKI